MGGASTSAMGSGKAVGVVVEEHVMLVDCGWSDANYGGSASVVKGG